jgi:hypothetical protein
MNRLNNFVNIGRKQPPTSVEEKEVRGREFRWRPLAPA